MTNAKTIRLKPAEEILALLKDVNKIFLISCTHCYREFKDEFSEETEEAK